MVEETTKKPAFDPHKLLAQLKGIVSKNKEPTQGGGKSWIGTLIIIAVVLVGIGVWSWLSFRRGRELAKFRHEKNKAQIRKEHLETFVRVDANNEKVAEAQREIDAAEEKLIGIEADIRAEEKRYEADMRAIDSIRSWRDAAEYRGR